MVHLLVNPSTEVTPTLIHDVELYVSIKAYDHTNSHTHN